MAKKSDVLSGKKVTDKEPVKEEPIKEKTAVTVAEEVKVSGEGLVEVTPENMNDLKESEGTGEEMIPVEGEISTESSTQEKSDVKVAESSDEATQVEDSTEEPAGEIEIEEAANAAPSASYNWKDESGVVVVEPEKEVKKATPVVRQTALDILKERAQRKITTPKTAVDVLNSRKKGYQASNSLEELKRRKLLR